MEPTARVGYGTAGAGYRPPGADYRSARADYRPARAGPTARDAASRAIRGDGPGDGAIHEAAARWATAKGRVGIRARDPVSAAAIAAPPPAGSVEASIPAVVPRAANAEVRVGTPAPDPRRGNPAPADSHRVDESVRDVGARRSFVDVLISVRHPHPAVLAGEDPLARRARYRLRVRRALRSDLGMLLQDPDLIVVVGFRPDGRRRGRRGRLQIGR